jgi:hypothetical protein
MSTPTSDCAPTVAGHSGLSGQYNDGSPSRRPRRSSEAWTCSDRSYRRKVPAASARTRPRTGIGDPGTPARPLGRFNGSRPSRRVCVHRAAAATPKRCRSSAQGHRVVALGQFGGLHMVAELVVRAVGYRGVPT